MHRMFDIGLKTVYSLYYVSNTHMYIAEYPNTLRLEIDVNLLQSFQSISAKWNQSLKFQHQCTNPASALMLSIVIRHYPLQGM